jgi:hypothetical protein
MCAAPACDAIAAATDADSTAADTDSTTADTSTTAARASTTAAAAAGEGIVGNEGCAQQSDGGQGYESMTKHGLIPSYQLDCGSGPVLTRRDTDEFWPRRHARD